jgi:hypothetical protein
LDHGHQCAPAGALVVFGDTFRRMQRVLVFGGDKLRRLVKIPF